MSKLLSEVPVEVLLDNVLPFCEVPDLLALGSTNRFFALLASDDTFWKRKLDTDFNFNGADTARTSGWKFIYLRMSNPKVFVWGEKTNGRLGLNKIPKTNVGDVPFPVQLRIPNVHVVSLVAGGMSFHALDSLGEVYVWGSLDGTSGLRSDGFSEASKSASTPLKLKLPAPTRSISCGRLHSTTLDANSHVWTFVNWGRPFRIVSSLLDCQSPDTTPAQIECGWQFSSVLTKSGTVLVFWPFEGQVHEAYTAKMEQLDQDRTALGHPIDGVIPCSTWDLENNPTELPPLPGLPQLTGTNLDAETLRKETALIKIAAMDRSLVGLTNKGHVVKIDLSTEGSRWEYLPTFSDVQEVKSHPVFSIEGKAELSGNMRITHISANFRSFFAYSTGTLSIVLMGTVDTGPHDQPRVTPELQNKSVISVVLGDYHYGALTSTGALYTWGGYSKGALGLGDPTTLAPGSPGGFATEAQRLRASENHFGTPVAVDVPTEVRFDHNLKHKTDRFCFAVAAAGWHMGALVIDLGDVPKDEEEELEEVDTQSHTRLGPPRGRGRGGRGIFNHPRIGFPGRGMPPTGPRV